MSTPSNVNVPTDVTFYCSYVSEWVDMIKEFEKQQLSCYPSFSSTPTALYRKGKTFTIREMVIATQSSKEWRVEEKRLNVINPILLNLKDILIDVIRDVFAVDEPFDHGRRLFIQKKNAVGSQRGLMQ